MEPKERIKTTAKAVGAAIKLESAGLTGECFDHNGDEKANMLAVREYIKAWPETSRTVAEFTINAYGAPNEISESYLIWFNNGPWKKTIIFREEIPHNYPAPHVDIIEQFINYKVPPDKLPQLANFDGSITVHRTKGEVSSRCDMESANFTALNLMHEIVTGQKNAESARKEFAEAKSAYLLNRASPYAEGFTFALPAGNTNELDKPEIVKEFMHQTIEKVKDKTFRKK